MTQQTESNWAAFIAKHKIAFGIFVAAIVLTCVGAVWVLVWYAGIAQTSGVVPSLLSEWSMNNALWFILNCIWELVSWLGIPVAIGAIVAWQYWKRLPEAEKRGLKSRNKHRGRVGGIGPLFTLAFMIKVYLDGNWNTPMASWNVDYVVGSMLTILLWTAAIFAIPAAAGFAYWMHTKSKKATLQPETPLNQPTA
jgi:hypothetical protein